MIERGSGFTAELCLDPANLRLRVDDYRGEPASLSPRIVDIARENALTKIFIKSREKDWLDYLGMGYMLEGIYKGYYGGGDAYCMALYLDPERRRSDEWIEEDRILRQVLALPLKPARVRAENDYAMRPASAEDAGNLAALFSQVFRTYPAPMTDSSYIVKAMEEETVFYVIERSGKLVSAASAEINAAFRNAEVTDCVTLPEERGKGLIRMLIHVLEDELRKRNIHSAYSLSRALSFGMNAALCQSGYQYSGRLTKNCDIHGQYEDMNLWVKILPSS